MALVKVPLGIYLAVVLRFASGFVSSGDAFDMPGIGLLVTVTVRMPMFGTALLEEGTVALPIAPVLARGGGGNCSAPPSLGSTGLSGPKLGRSGGTMTGGGGRGVRPAVSSFLSRSSISLFWPASSVSRCPSSRDFWSMACNWASAWPRQASLGST
jgi:hypothetical protein